MENENSAPSSPLKGIVSVVVGLLLAILGYKQFAPGDSSTQTPNNSAPPARQEPVDKSAGVENSRTSPSAAPTSGPGTKPAVQNSPRRDLEIDERHHGHTLAKHVGKTDAELLQRLKNESDISSASTWNDRDTAERCVGEALAENAQKIQAWVKRGGDEKLALDHTCSSPEAIGRSMRHGKSVSEPCHKARIVLAIDRKSGDYFVLTAYPEAR